MSPEQVAESLALLKQDVAFAEVAARTLIEVRGDDRTRFLHNVCTNDINALAVGGGCEAFLTSVQGKTLLHCFVFCEDDRLVIDASPNHAEAVLPHLTKYALIDDIALEDRSSESKQLLVLGTNAEQTLSKLNLATPTQMLGHASADDITVCRVPFVAEPCFALRAASPEILEQIAQRLVEAGVSKLAAAGVDAARISAGFPEFGQDITADNLPQEVGRDKLAISFTKGCYLGQETVARIDALGHVNKYLVRLESVADLNAGDELFSAQDDGKAMGKITSAVRLPERTLALGYVRREAKEANAELACHGAAVRLAK